MTLIKIKQTVILSAKWVNLGIAEDKQTVAKNHGQVQQRRGPLFYREKGGNWKRLF